MSEEITNLSEVNQTPSTTNSKGKLFLAFVFVVAIGLGILTGFYLSGKTKTSSPAQTGVVSQEKIVKGSEFGSNDLAKFKDTAIGTLEKNGLDGEGTHRLIREGGPSQTVYLTSSVLDLDQFVGRKIQVWGETFQAQKAGWFMDVGRIKVME